MTLYQKLAQIRGLVSHLQYDKSTGTGSYSYSYVTDEAILSRIQDEMAKLEVSLIPEVVPGTTRIVRNETREVKRDKDGNPYDKVSVDYVTTADMVYRWVNDVDPLEFIEVPWSLVGIQNGASQSFGAGLTYSMRYFLLKYFNIATTEDDPDEYARKQTENTKKQKAADDKRESGQINAQINDFVKAALLKNPEARDDITKLIMKYVKLTTKKESANYFEITDPAVSQKLLEELQKKYGE